jgi:uncharacterized protein YcbX
MPLAVARICRYPVKGLSAEPLEAVALEPGRAIAGDRRFAIAHGSGALEGELSEWLPKQSFLMLARNERLAALETRFDEKDGTLVVKRGGKPVARGKIVERVGRALIEEFFAAYMREEARGKPRLVRAAAGHTISDHRAAVVSLINLASVRDLERVVGGPVDPIRFRANLYFEGDRPWQEFEWLDREIAVGGARLLVTARIARCAATNVDPKTAARDLNIPRALERGFGHADCGVYARVVGAGGVAVGDVLGPPG